MYKVNRSVAVKEGESNAAGEEVHAMCISAAK